MHKCEVRELLIKLAKICFVFERTQTKVCLCNQSSNSYLTELRKFQTTWKQSN